MINRNPYPKKIFRLIISSSLALVGACCVMVGCNFTTTISKDPEFSVDIKTVQDSLKTLVSYENINLAGVETKTSGKTSSELVIRVINSTNLPSGDKPLIDLGKTIASQLRRELKNQHEFNTYKVLFVKQQIKGEVTKTDYTGWVFKSEEL